MQLEVACAIPCDIRRATYQLQTYTRTASTYFHHNFNSYYTSYIDPSTQPHSLASCMVTLHCAENAALHCIAQFARKRLKNTRTADGPALISCLASISFQSTNANLVNNAQEKIGREYRSRSAWSSLLVKHPTILLHTSAHLEAQLGVELGDLLSPTPPSFS